MQEEMAQKLSSRIDAFRAAASQPFSLIAQKTQESEMHITLHQLVHDHGHDVEAHDAIVQQLDSLFDTRPALARSLAYKGVTDANVRHGWNDNPKDREKNEIRTVLEGKLALQWRFMLMNDDNLTVRQKLAEARDTQSTARMSSTLLVQEAAYAIKLLTSGPQ